MISLRVLVVSSLVGVFAAAAPVSADLIFEETAPNTWRLDFDPITFSAAKNGGGEYDWLIFKDVFGSNATASGSTPSEQVSLTINAGSANLLNLNSANGTFNNTLGSLTPRDLLVNFTAAGKPTINIGDTILVTAPAGGFIISINSAGVPPVPPSGTFQTGIYSAGSGGSLSTDQVGVSIVPEPGSLGLIALGGGLLAWLRRRGAGGAVASMPLQ